MQLPSGYAEDFTRHAARYPEEGDPKAFQKDLPSLRDRILQAYENNQTLLCRRIIDALKQWEYGYNDTQQGHITPVGERTAALIGMRYQKRFPWLLPRHFNSADYLVQFTTRIRTKQTAEAFMNAIIDKEGNETIADWDQPNDDLVQFHQNCNKRLKEYAGYKKAPLREKNVFLNTPAVRTLVRVISRRVGFNVTFDEARVMAKYCSFETSLNSTSPFCAIFKREDFKIFEFFDDINDYYRDAYALKRNYEQACPMVRELWERLATTAKYYSESGNRTEPPPRKAVLYFSHGGGFKKLVARLGLFRDNQDIRGSGYCYLKDHRKWRSSFANPFSANLAFVLFKCRENFYVLSYLHERPVIVEGCYNYFCPLDDFLSSPAAWQAQYNCDLKKICVPTPYEGGYQNISRRGTPE
ncbi:multiple inositol polyphosphate phosphatase 1-like isoform X2 [Ornithodoros turicata]|uniref:multiple inositol polyphosphate phosphatase 1-like isoform X2 n=1 Tax=Ornithodoros turicata TaxID=34597 RepID=UPI0031387A38